jgi:hypothetical protein
VSQPRFPISVETFVATLARVAATKGDATSVALLTESTPSINWIDSDNNWGQTYNIYTLRLHISPDFFARLDDESEDIVTRLAELASRVSRAHDEFNTVNTILLAPALLPSEGWREHARAWLRGEGINNQGRVRSDNIASRQHDGLLFRSTPEIFLYEALKARGVYFAPLPVVVRGGTTFQRLEPDFLVIHDRVVMVVEVDGATVHRETPAEAHERIQGLTHQGVRVERVKADECSTRARAVDCAGRLVAAIERYRLLGG